MGGLSFGIDGDGNRGYYGADGSLVPFKKENSFCGVVESVNNLFVIPTPSKAKAVCMMIASGNTVHGCMYNVETLGTSWYRPYTGYPFWRALATSRPIAGTEACDLYISDTEVVYIENGLSKLYCTVVW